MNKKTIHQFSAGVNILLERVKTNPEEFAHDGKFSGLVDDVYTSMGKSRYEAVVGRGNLLRVLTAEELTALHDAFIVLDRPKFDAWIMKEILGTEETTLKFRATERYSTSFSDPALLANYALAQNSALASGLHPSMLQNSISHTLDSQSYANLTQPKPKSFWSKFFNGMIGR